MRLRGLAFVGALTLLALLVTGTLVGPDRAAQMAAQDGAVVAAYTDHDAIWIDGNSDFLSQAAAESWDGNGTASNPIIIEGYRITDSTTQCIRLWNVDLFWIIRNCLLEGGPPYVCGLWAVNISNGEFSGNVIRDRHSGILAYGGSVNCNFTGNQVYDNTANAFEGQGGMLNCIISDNVFHDNFGANLWITGGYTNTLISDNTITDGTYGINAAGGIGSVVHHNTISETEMDGLMVLSSSNMAITENTVTCCGGQGILVSGGNFIVESNTVADSSEIGIRVASGGFHVIQNNTVTNSTEYGLSLSPTTDNATVTKNSFINNSDGCQIEDDGEDNVFYFNHYSDWTAPDLNADNVVDEPYLLDGDAANQDRYPLVDIDGPTIPTATGNTVTGSTTEGTGGSMDLVPFVAVGAIVILVIVAVFLKRGR